MFYELDDDIAQGMNYRRWIQIQRVKNSATTTQQPRKDRTVTIRATNLIKYGDALFTTSFLSQIMMNLISVGMRQVDQQKILVMRGMG